MPWWLWRRRIPMALFVLCLLLAASLVGLVLLAPKLAADQSSGDWTSRTLALFASDAAVRRTAIGAAVGLVATALVFFRPPYTRPPRAPTDVIGA